jgi:nitrite reductase/ring-hydroxylating ferredoxin subunit/uncharacterized membrane protein
MATGASVQPLLPLVEQIESAEALDGPGKAIGKQIRSLFSPGKLKDALSGTPTGHPIHPLLTDVVIGSFVSASVLDVLGGDEDGTAAQRLIGVGLAAYGPTAVTGVNDWADSEATNPAVRRVGLVHAASNAAAVTLYASSLAARRRGAHGRGKVLALAGAGVLSAAGYLGAHLTYAQGVGTNQTAFDKGPEDWTEVDPGDLPDGGTASVVLGDTPVLLVRHGGHLHALHDRCSHRGCSLADGKLDGEVIQCSCHGSRFSLRDGAIERGPATVPQPAYEVRESGDRIEVRLGG